MTRCRTGCGAEINYKAVHFSSPVDWYDIPMEGDVIHDCPKLNPAPNDDANEHLKNLESMHVMLHDHILNDMQYDYGSYIQNFVDLPHELKMHSKGKLAARAWAGSGPHYDMAREDYDKLPKSRKDELKNTYGFEPPASTPEERIEDFWRDINTTAIPFLQRCADMCPAPFYVDKNGYSQLVLFRIFLESKEQYGDAMICHTIQGAIDIAKSQMDADAFTEITDRLQKKLEDQRLAKADAEAEYQIEEKKRLVSQGMDEKEVQYQLDMHQQGEEHDAFLDEQYPASMMIWALDQYKKEFDKSIEENKQDDALEHDREQIEVDDTTVKEQSAEELLKPHSQEYWGDLHKRLREFILKLHEGKINWAELGADDIYDQIQIMKDKQSKTSYTFANKSDLGVATLGQLVAILRNPVTAKKAKQEGIGEYEKVVDKCKVVLECRNALDHDERKELPPGWKEANAGLCSMLNEFFDNLKYR